MPWRVAVPERLRETVLHRTGGCRGVWGFQKDFVRECCTAVAVAVAVVVARGGSANAAAASQS